MSIFKRVKLLWLLNKRMKHINHSWYFSHWSKPPWQDQHKLGIGESRIGASETADGVHHVLWVDNRGTFTPWNMLKHWSAASITMSVFVGDKNVFNSKRDFMKWPASYEWCKMTTLTKICVCMGCFLEAAMRAVFPLAIKLSVLNELLECCICNIDIKYYAYTDNKPKAQEEVFGQVAEFLPSCKSPDELEFKLTILT